MSIKSDLSSCVSRELIVTMLEVAGWNPVKYETTDCGIHLTATKKIRTWRGSITVYLGLIMNFLPDDSAAVLTCWSFNAAWSWMRHPGKYLLGGNHFLDWYGKHQMSDREVKSGNPDGGRDKVWYFKRGCDVGALFKAYDELAFSQGKLQLFRPRGKAS